MGEIADQMMEDYFDEIDRVASHSIAYVRAYDQNDEPKPCSIWTQSSGKEINVKDMGYQHIVNCISKLKRDSHLPDDETKRWIKSFQKELCKR